MSLKVGNRVKFLNDVGEGTITALIDRKTVMVSTEDGFDIPVLIADLIPVGEEKPQTSRNVEVKKQAEPLRDAMEEETPPGPVMDDEVVLAVYLRGNTDIRASLINMCSYHLYFSISLKSEGEQLHILDGKLEPETEVLLPRLVPASVDEPLVIYTDLLFFNQHTYRMVPPVHKKLEIYPRDIYSGLMLGDNDYIENKAAILPVFQFRKKDEGFENRIAEDNLKEVLRQKEAGKTIKPEKPAEKKPEIEEVDLHIQNITDNYSGLGNGEILEIQLARFKTSLETAMIHKTRKIVFIHGVGNGKLKFELRKRLDRDYPDLKYQDASFREYGYGATMVFIPSRK